MWGHVTHLIPSKKTIKPIQLFSILSLCSKKKKKKLCFTFIKIPILEIVSKPSLTYPLIKYTNTFKHTIYFVLILTCNPMRLKTAFQDLYQIVKYSKTIRILWLTYINKRTCFWCGKRNVFISNYYFKLLLCNPVRGRRQGIILFHIVTVINNFLQFFYYTPMYMCIFPDHDIIFAIAVLAYLSFPSNLGSNSKNSCPNLPLCPA